MTDGIIRFTLSALGFIFGAAVAEYVVFRRHESDESIPAAPGGGSVVADSV